MRDGATGRRRAAGKGGSQWARHGTALPSWTDLETPPTRGDADDGAFLQSVSTVRFALLVLLLAGAFTLYVGHVHATEDLLSQVQEARTENRRLHLKHNRLKGAYDRKVSPKAIYERARELGLRSTTSYGPSITLPE